MIIKNVTFLTTCHNTIQGCGSKENQHKLLEVKVKIPLDKRESVSKDTYKLVAYLEGLTGFFLLDILKINNKKY